MTNRELIKHATKIVGEFNLSNEYFRAGNVAAALISDTGKVYTGICIDIACGIGFCAEHSAIAEMLKHRETNIEMIVTVNNEGKILSPCGRCREMIYQINHNNIKTKVIINEKKVVTINELLPFRFQ